MKCIKPFIMIPGLAAWNQFLKESGIPEYPGFLEDVIRPNDHLYWTLLEIIAKSVQDSKSIMSVCNLFLNLGFLYPHDSKTQPTYVFKELSLLIITLK